MNLTDLYEHLGQRMIETRKEYLEISTMIKNAETDGIDYKDWPQYIDYLKLSSKWATYRELKEVVAIMISQEALEKSIENDTSRAP